ncbi:MAG: ECF transporter S component [Thermoanaerobacterales bacterium]|nr:ECF transporter S component [Thermoanaerobacterales bacterium]
MNKNVTRLAFYGLFMALVVIVTAVIRVPVPTFNLYFNLGEAIIYLTAILYGGPAGAIIGGVGSSLADLLVGAPVWAPITLIIKGLEGYVVGSVAKKGNLMLAVLLGAIVMITGYAIAAGILYGIAAVPVELAGDSVQVLAGGIIALFLYNRLKKFLTDDND